MPNIEQLKSTDFDECMTFFKEAADIDLNALMPATYRATDEHMSCNYAIRENGHICAVATMPSTTLRVGRVALQATVITGLATRPSLRGRGYMSALMQHCGSEMKVQGVHLSYLSGQRHRYRYFGYEKCGYYPNVAVLPTDLKHAFKDEPSLHFEPLHVGDAARLDQARRWHAQQRVYCPRKAEDFYAILSSWHNRPHVALDEDGVMQGYVVATKSGDSVAELIARDVDTAVELVRAWVTQQGGRVIFELMPTNCELLRRLSALGNGYGVSFIRNWQVFDWETTVRALLEVRCQLTSMPDGKARFAIEDYGVLEVGVRGGQVEVTRMNGRTEARWHPFTAMRLLFGPLAPSFVAELPKEAAALSSWCPLPLAWPPQDIT